MARRTLTDNVVLNLSTTKPSLDVWHDKWPHRGSFGLRVSKTGRKTWKWRENLQDPETGKTKTISHSLGLYPNLVLDEAMEMAYQLARAGLAPDAPKIVRDLEPILMDRYKRDRASPTTIKHREATLRLRVMPEIGDMRIRDVRVRHLQDLIDKEERLGHFGNAVDIKAAMVMLFKPVLRLEAHFFNPSLGLELTKVDRRSKRVRQSPVDMQVLVDVWQAAEELWREAVEADIPGAAVRYLLIQMQIACCQRTRVTLEIDRECIHKDWWIHPGEYTDTREHPKKGPQTKVFRTKNGKPMGVPLLPLIRSRLEKAMALAPAEQRFLCARFVDWWPANIYYQRIMLDLRKRSGRSKEEWWPHRSRSVYYTLMTRAGHPVEKVRRVASHSDGGPQVTLYYIEPEPRDPVVKEMLEAWNAMLVEALDVAENGEPISAVS